MQVKVTREFRAVPVGAVYPKEFHVDEIVDGRIAEIALELKSGEEISEDPAAEQPEQKSDESQSQKEAGGADVAAASATVTVQLAAKPNADSPKTVIVRARLKDKYEGPDEKGKTIKIVKGGVVSAPLAQKLVDEGLAVVLETKPA